MSHPSLGLTFKAPKSLGQSGACQAWLQKLRHPQAGLTWGLSASALGLDEAIDVTVHITAFQSQPYFLIELGERK